MLKGSCCAVLLPCTISCHAVLHCAALCRAVLCCGELCAVLSRVQRSAGACSAGRTTGHCTAGLQDIGDTLKISGDTFALGGLLLTIITILFSSVVFFAEQLNQDWDAEQRLWVLKPAEGQSPADAAISHFQSIPHTFWWCMVTLTTVGYGDMVWPLQLPVVAHTTCGLPMAMIAR